MTFATAVPILFTSFVYRTNLYWSFIHGIKRKPHLSMAWNWYHFVAIATWLQPRPTYSADINTRLQLSDTSSIPPMHGGFVLLFAWRYNVTTILIDPPQTTILDLYSLNDNASYRQNSKPWDWMLYWSYRSEIWKASRQRWRRRACQTP